MKFVIAAIAIVGIIAFVVYTQSKSEILPTNSIPQPIQSMLKMEKEKSVSYTASFAIFTNGTLRVFTNAMYHNLSEDAYIQTDNPNIIHVEKGGITWNDFFKTLPFSLTKDCLTTGTSQTFCTGDTGTLEFYLDGTRDDNLLDRAIGSGDRMLITFGAENEAQIKTQLDQIPDPSQK